MTADDGGAPQAEGARRVLLARHCGPSETDHAVHLLPLPHDAQACQDGAVSALCGIAMHPGELETVAPGEGVWCPWCFVAHVTGSAAPPATVLTTSAGYESTVAEYRDLGWPIVRRGQDLSVNLDTLHALAVVIPTALATEVTGILIRRRCAPAVLAHPALPTHRIVLAGERFPVPLTWPAGVHRITGTLLLPRNPARIWLTLNGAWKTTVVFTDPEAAQLAELLTQAQQPPHQTSKN